MDAPQQPVGSPPAETSSPTTPTPTTPPASPATPETPPAAQPTLVGAAPPAVAPLTAESFTLPEGLSLDNDSMTEFLGVMNNPTMSAAERAQALVNLQAGLAAKSSEMGSQAWNDQQAAWQAEIQADPELGGANLQKTIAGIGQLMDRFGTPEIRAAFDSTGAGNNPHIVRFLSTLVSQLKEPAPIPPGAPGSGGQGRSLEERLYPSTGAN